jgi:hypothetical protein
MLIKAATDHIRTNVAFDKLCLAKWAQGAEENLWSEDYKCHAEGVEQALRIEQVGFGSVTINTPATKKAILAAIENNDSQFFVWFGRVLSTDWASKGKMPKFLAFLLGHWDRADDGLPELLYLTMSGVTDVCSTVLGETYTEDAVTKRCKRLGLLSSPGKKIKVTPGNKKLTFLTPDGETFLWPAAPRTS